MRDACTGLAGLIFAYPNIDTEIVLTDLPRLAERYEWIALRVRCFADGGLDGQQKAPSLGRGLQGKAERCR